MSRKILIYILFLLFFVVLPVFAFGRIQDWRDDFKGKRINTAYWSKIPNGLSQWDKYMSQDEDLYVNKRGKLELKVIKSDNTYKTAGIYTKGKVSFGYGRLEVRVLINPAQGTWPAIWMKPVEDIKTPLGGEFDIMEHLNHDEFVYQTIHSGYTQKRKEQGRPNYVKYPIKLRQFNTFAIEHHKDYIAFYVNGVETLRYDRREDDTEEEWPFDRDYYLLIDQQAGGDWAGKINSDDLPFSIVVDWVKFTSSTK